MMIDPAVALVVRIVLALLMASAARHKLVDLESFRDNVARYRIVPPAPARALATALPFVEIVLAVTIAAGVALLLAGFALAFLLLVYAAAIAVNVRRGRTDLDCGCMGPAAATPVSGALVVRNLVLVVAAMLVALPVSDRSLALLDVVGILASTAALAACWSAGERMLVLETRVAAMRARQRSAR